MLLSGSLFITTTHPYLFGTTTFLNPLWCMILSLVYLSTNMSFRFNLTERYNKCDTPPMLCRMLPRLIIYLDLGLLTRNHQSSAPIKLMPPTVTRILLIRGWSITLNCIGLSVPICILRLSSIFSEAIATEMTPNRKLILMMVPKIYILRNHH